MPKDAPGGLQSSQEASSYVFSRAGETHDAESYVFYRAGEAPGGPRRQLYTCRRGTVLERPQEAPEGESLDTQTSESDTQKQPRGCEGRRPGP